MFCFFFWKCIKFVRICFPPLKKSSHSNYKHYKKPYIITLNFKSLKIFLKWLFLPQFNDFQFKNTPRGKFFHSLLNNAKLFFTWLLSLKFKTFVVAEEEEIVEGGEIISEVCCCRLLLVLLLLLLLLLILWLLFPIISPTWSSFTAEWRFFLWLCN